MNRLNKSESIRALWAEAEKFKKNTKQTRQLTFEPIPLGLNRILRRQVSVARSAQSEIREKYNFISSLTSFKWK